MQSLFTGCASLVSDGDSELVVSSTRRRGDAASVRVRSSGGGECEADGVRGGGAASLLVESCCASSRSGAGSSAPAETQNLGRVLSAAVSDIGEQVLTGGKSLSPLRVAVCLSRAAPSTGRTFWTSHGEAGFWGLFFRREFVMALCSLRRWPGPSQSSFCSERRRVAGLKLRLGLGLYSPDWRRRRRSQGLWRSSAAERSGRLARGSLLLLRRRGKFRLVFTPSAKQTRPCDGQTRGRGLRD